MMCTVYLDQVAKPVPMADGAEAAGAEDEAAATAA